MTPIPSWIPASESSRRPSASISASSRLTASKSIPASITVGAAVALKEGESVSAEQLRDYMKQKVAAYKYPRVIWFMEDLPTGATGKVLKREIQIPARVTAQVR